MEGRYYGTEARLYQTKQMKQILSYLQTVEGTHVTDCGGGLVVILKSRRITVIGTTTVSPKP
ncbi:MAG: hypothetical protein ACLTTJ_14135 [Blautia sp.]